MKVIYGESVIEKINRVILEAVAANKSIKKIILTKGEFKEFEDEVVGWVRQTTPIGPGQAGRSGRYIIYRAIIVEEGN